MILKSVGEMPITIRMIAKQETHHRDDSHSYHLQLEWWELDSNVWISVDKETFDKANHGMDIYLVTEEPKDAT